MDKIQVLQWHFEANGMLCGFGFSLNFGNTTNHGTDMTLMDDSKENEAEDEAIVFGESKGMSEFDVQLAARACVYPQISRVPLIQLSILQNVVTHLTFMPLWYTSSNLNFRCCFPNFSTSVST